jgi:hypothetical protein
MDDLGVHTQMNPRERQNVMECFNVAHDGANWQNLTNEVMNLLVSWNIRRILTKRPSASQDRDYGFLFMKCWWWSRWVNGYTDLVPVNDTGYASKLQQVFNSLAKFKMKFWINFLTTAPSSEAGLHNSERGEGQVVTKKRAEDCRVDSEGCGLLTFLIK